MKKLLVTGFKPFLKEPINPSEILALELGKRFSDIDVLVLPVSYERSFLDLQRHYLSYGPFDAVIMIGQAGGRNSVCLERVALNWSENSLQDEDGIKLPQKTLIDSAPASYISDFFPNDWKDELSKIGATTVSFSAGTYVCNALYYRVIHSLTQNKIPALFVHVPYLPEQVENKPEMPSMPLATQSEILSALITLMKK
ncbi:MAG TPA: pyroglutamyl-peptidase I [Bdellovibrio sp.]|uniref:pyroglutamyl-peptidase I n=1 Tax=Bdellovibrio sp. TaxID=28201 RepID=UPI002F0A8FFC